MGVLGASFGDRIFNVANEAFKGVAAGGEILGEGTTSTEGMFTSVEGKADTRNLRRPKSD